MGLGVCKIYLISVKNSECKREKSAELKVPSKRKSVTSSHSSSKKSIENSDISKDVNSCSLENQENQVNSANSNDDNSEATSNASDTRSKEPECCQTNTSKHFYLTLVLQLVSDNESMYFLLFC